MRLILFTRYWVPVILYASLLFYLSSLTSAELPNVHLWDKLEHFMAYSGLGFLLSRALRPDVRHWSSPMILGAAFAGAVLYGISDEFHQSFVPTRAVEVGDVIADGLGGFAGGICFVGYQYVRKRYRSFTGRD